jgi:hypothetical protein
MKRFRGSRFRVQRLDNPESLSAYLYGGVKLELRTETE